MSKIALLVMCHRLEAVRDLVSLLDDRFSVFIHLDAKSAISDTSLPTSAAHETHLISQFPVFWGGWNMVAATRALLKAARARGQFDRYVLVSGDSLPVASVGEIAEALLATSDEYLDLFELPKAPELAGVPASETRKLGAGFEHAWRFYNFVARDPIILGGTPAPVGQDYGSGSDHLVFGSEEEATQKILQSLPPRSPLFDKIYGGSQWWALTGDLIAAISDELFSDEIEKYFQFFEVPDEHVFQCLVGRNLAWIEQNGHALRRSMMLTDHTSRSQGQHFLTAEGFRDARRLHGDHLLFGRKYEPWKTPDIAEAIRDGAYESPILATHGLQATA
jgi:hypothetical protein